MTTNPDVRTSANPVSKQAKGVIGVWAITRIYILVIGVIGALSSYQGNSWFVSFVRSWSHFDTLCYQSIVEFGYLGTDICTYNTAFFPGLPLLMAAFGLVGIDSLAAGLIISLVASLFAGLALGKLAELYGAKPVLTTAIWFTAPMAVFLFAPYTEPLFAALSFWAWYFAKTGNWLVAGVLAGFSGLVRSNGLFLAGALVLLFLISKNRNWSDSWKLILPFLGTFLYFTYLYWLTGSWTHWADVQAEGWDREFTDPITSTLNTFQIMLNAEDYGFTPSRFISEIVNVGTVLVLGIVMLFKRWWAEAAYVFVTMGSLITSEFYYSTPRATLILFPVWLLLGLWIARSKALVIVYFVIAIPFLTLIVLRYVTGQWIS